MIVDIVAVPGLSSIGEAILVGIKLGNGRFAWGSCEVGDVSSGINTLQHVIRPALMGQPLDQFRPLAERLETVTETFVITQTITPLANVSPKLSRRVLFSNLLSAEPPPAKSHTFQEERPIPTAIQLGVSWALLSAVALHQNKTTAEVIAEEYGLSQEFSAVPMGLVLNNLESDIPKQWWNYISAVYYHPLVHDPVAQWGKSGEQLQQQLQKFKNHIASQTDKHPCLYINLSGSFTQLFQNDAGKILGALYGLEHTLKPFPLYIANPIIVENDVSSMGLLKKLKDYAHMRHLLLKLTLEIQPEFTISGDAFWQYPATHLVHINLTRMGSLNQAILTGLRCQQAGIGVTLEGPTQILESMATTLHPLLIISSEPDQLHNTVTQMLAGR